MSVDIFVKGLNRDDFFHEVDGRKAIQPGKSAWSVLRPELKCCILPLLEGNNEGRKTNTRADTLNGEHYRICFIISKLYA